MQHEAIIAQTAAYVQAELAGAEGGHDWAHIERVWRLARHIADTEPTADRLVVELGALLHDIADAKFHGGNEDIGPQKAAAFLQRIAVPQPVTDHVVQIIRHISFKGGGPDGTFSSPELDIVQDADRMDALGAIGIARAFNYGGFKGRSFYDPAIPPKAYADAAAYRSSQAPTINHFYEKLLLLKDRMRTVRGREIAAQRHAFLEQYLDQFFGEWNGTDYAPEEIDEAKPVAHPATDKAI